VQLATDGPSANKAKERLALYQAQKPYRLPQVELTANSTKDTNKTRSETTEK